MVGVRHGTQPPQYGVTDVAASALASIEAASGRQGAQETIRPETLD
jgi:hypothetical protein